MGQALYRDTWVEVNLNAIEYNIQQIKQKLPKNSQIFAVVKANAYGHGDVQVAKKALASGANALAVALLEEAIALREAGITAPILVLGWVPPKGAIIASEYNISLTFYQKKWLQEVNTYTFAKELQLHMKWDTGMGRSGICNEQELKQILAELDKNNQIRLQGVYTHFATADEEDLTYFNKQYSRFEHLLEVFHNEWEKSVCIHIGNSSASIRLPDKMHDAIRFGVAMYGLYPGKVIKEKQEIDLKESFSLHSRLVHVKQMEAGESVGYGATYKVEEKEWIGTLLIGYGDGWSRKMQDFTVLVDGKHMPIVGRVCMDQMMIRLDKKYPIGTKVTLIGKQGEARISIDDVAEYLDTINYEIPCMINRRVPRIYV